MVVEWSGCWASKETSAGMTAVNHAANYSNTKELGRLIYTDYVYPFELAAVLLLVAMVAAIALTLRKADAKRQDVSEQVKVKKQDRLRIVPVPSPRRVRQKILSHRRADIPQIKAKGRTC